MFNYTISEFVELLDNGKLSLNDILNIRKFLNIPFKIHPLGFYSCTLLHENNQKIRLHYWDSSIGVEQQSSELVIHDHIFNFKSWILLGVLENIEYDIVENGEVYNLYTTKYKNDLSILEEAMEVIKIIQKNTSIYVNGQSYLMEAGILHKTRILTDKAFTVLHTIDSELITPRVLSNTYKSKTETIFNRKDVSEQDVVDKLKFLF